MGQGSTFKRRLRDASVVDLLFYLMLLVCVVLQAWGYSFTDRAYMGSVALMGILVVAKIASSRYGARELIICAMLIGSGLFFAVRAHRYTLLLTAVLLIAAKDIDIDELLERYLVIQAMGIFALPSLYEGLGIVAIEAQSAGLPTICSMGVAEDANVSSLFQRVSLDDGPAAWVSTIVDNAGVREPVLGSEGVKAHGFDVRDNSLKMQEWYLKEAADAR